jgi:hypothetical protein
VSPIDDAPGPGPEEYRKIEILNDLEMNPACSIVLAPLPGML